MGRSKAKGWAVSEFVGIQNTSKFTGDPLNNNNYRNNNLLMITNFEAFLCFLSVKTNREKVVLDGAKFKRIPTNFDTPWWWVYSVCWLTGQGFEREQGKQLH